MKNPEVQIITECGPCMGNDWRYPKEYHLNQPSKPHNWKGTRPWSHRYSKQNKPNTNKSASPKITYITKLIKFFQHVFFLEEEEESQEEEEQGSITSEDNLHS